MKWEYLVLQAAQSNGGEFQDILNKIGVQGWELVCSTGNTRTNAQDWVSLIFKRPKGDA